MESLAVQNEFGFDLDKALDIDQLYVPSDSLPDVFFPFSYRLESLQRYYVFTSGFVERYTAGAEIALHQYQDPLFLAERENKLMDHPDAEEMGAFYDPAAESGSVSDIVYSDDEYFVQYLRGSVIAHLFTLIEGLFTDVSDKVADNLGQTVELPEKRMPYINRYVIYLQRSCGLLLNIDKPTWKRIDALREVRNRYIHRISQDLPEQIRIELQKLLELAETPETQLSSDAFVNAAFETIGDLATRLTEAYVEFLDSEKQK